MTTLAASIPAIVMLLYPIKAATVCSWYGPGFNGNLTASGEVYDETGFTCAHRWLPFGTVIQFEAENRRVVTRLTDRGPFVSGREFDLSRAAFGALMDESVGVARMHYRVVWKGGR